MVRSATLVLALLIAPAATAAPIPNTEAAERSIPDLGAETEVEVGQAMVMRESVITATSLRLLNQVKSEKFGLGVRVTLNPTVYHLDHTDKRGRYFAPPGATTVGPRARWPVEGIFVPNDGGGAPMAYMEALLATKRVEAPGMNLEAADQSGFRRELIYSGVSQGTVTIVYREFVNDFARPAFSQELKYDLAAGAEVGFRGARLEIIKATNTSIRFRLTRPLDGAPPPPAQEGR